MSYERDVMIRNSEVVKKNCPDWTGYEPLSCLIEDIVKGKTLEASLTGNVTGNLTGQQITAPTNLLANASASNAKVEALYTTAIANTTGLKIQAPAITAADIGKKFVISNVGKYEIQIEGTGSHTFTDVAIAESPIPNSGFPIQSGSTIQLIVQSATNFLVVYTDLFPALGFIVDSGIAGEVSWINRGQASNYYDVIFYFDEVNLGTVSGGVAEDIGIKLGDLPAGYILIKDCIASLSFTNSDGNIDADTPQFGIGTTQAAGATGSLGATEYNILDGTAGLADVNGAVNDFASGSLDLEITRAATRPVYLNLADTWAAGGESSGILASGTVLLRFMKVA